MKCTIISIQELIELLAGDSPSPDPKFCCRIPPAGTQNACDQECLFPFSSLGGRGTEVLEEHGDFRDYMHATDCTLPRQVTDQFKSQVLTFLNLGRPVSLDFCYNAILCAEYPAQVNSCLTSLMYVCFLCLQLVKLELSSSP